MNPITKILKTQLFQSSTDKLNTLLNMTAFKDEALFSKIMGTSTDDEIIALLNARDDDYLAFAMTYDLIDIFLLELYEQRVSLRPLLSEINQYYTYEHLIKGYQMLGFKTEAQKLTVVLEYGKEEEINYYGVTNTTRISFDFDDI